MSHYGSPQQVQTPSYYCQHSYLGCMQPNDRLVINSKTKNPPPQQWITPYPQGHYYCQVTTHSETATSPVHQKEPSFSQYLERLSFSSQSSSPGSSSPADFCLSRKTSSTSVATVATDYVDHHARNYTALPFQQQSGKTKVTISSSQPHTKDYRWIPLRNIQEEARANISQKTKLPSIKDIRTFNFLPQPDPADIKMKRVSSCTSLRREFSISDGISSNQLRGQEINCSHQVPRSSFPQNELQGHATTEPVVYTKGVATSRESPVKGSSSKTSSSKPSANKAFSTNSLNHSKPSVVMRREVSGQKITKTKTYNRAMNKFTKGQSLTPAMFFPQVVATEQFLIENILRDPDLKSRIDVTQEIQCFEITQEDIIRFKIFEFLFGYLGLNDIREEFSGDKEEMLTNLECKENTFEINVEFVLEETREKKTTTIIKVFLVAFKPTSSSLDKATILQCLQVQFDEFFVGYGKNQWERESNGKKKRRSRAIYGKPRWGTGYEDELSVIELKVKVDKNIEP